MIDVKNIHDIPFEMHLDFTYQFDFFDRDSGIMGYSHQKDEGHGATAIEVISDAQAIFDNEKFSDLITQENITFLQFSCLTLDRKEILKSWAYRPLVPDSEKIFE